MSKRKIKSDSSDDSDGESENKIVQISEPNEDEIVTVSK